MKINILSLFYLFIFSQNCAYSQVLTRGPYLQMGSQTAMTIRWRTDVATIASVHYGTSVSNLNQAAVGMTATTEHEIRLGNLTPDTKYFYSIGSTSTVLQGNADNYFVTMPPSVQNEKFGLWASVTREMALKIKQMCAMRLSIFAGQIRPM